MTTTNHLGITLVEQAQSQKEVTVNAALIRLDALRLIGCGSKFNNGDKMKVNRTDFNNSLLDYGFKDYQIKAIQERMDKHIYPQIESIPMQAGVIVNFAEEEKTIIKKLVMIEILKVQQIIYKDVIIPDLLAVERIPKLKAILSKISE